MQLLCLGSEHSKWEMAQSVNSNHIQLSWALQQRHRGLHPGVSLKPRVCPASPVTDAAWPRSLLCLWCLVVPTCWREISFLPCKGIEMFTLLSDGVKHTYACIHVEAVHACTHKLSSAPCFEQGLKVITSGLGISFFFFNFISEVTINPAWFWTLISQALNHRPFIFRFHALCDEECSEFPNSFHKLFRTKNVMLKKSRINKLSIFAGDGALRIKAEGLVLPLSTMAWSEHPKAQDSKIFGMTECGEHKYVKRLFILQEWSWICRHSLNLGREKAAILQRVCEPLDSSA